MAFRKPLTFNKTDGPVRRREQNPFNGGFGLTFHNPFITGNLGNSAKLYPATGPDGGKRSVIPQAVEGVIGATPGSVWKPEE